MNDELEMTLDMEEGENKGFAIEDDRKAEWAIGKIAEARAEVERWEAYYNERLEAIKKDAQNTIDFMTDHLRRYFQTVPHKTTKTGIEKYALPSATLQLKPASIEWEKDDMALLEWCETNLPEAVKVTRKAGWAEVKAHMKATGEIPQGVTPVEKLPTFEVKEAKA